MEINRIMDLNKRLQDIKTDYESLVLLKNRIIKDEIQFTYNHYVNNSNRPFWASEEILVRPLWNDWTGKKETDEITGNIKTTGRLKDYYKDIKEFYINIIDKEIDKLEKEANKIFKSV